MKLFKQIAFASALTIAAFLDLATAHAHETKIGDIVISHPWSRQSPMAADVGAGFMVIENTGQQDDRLVRATATISDNVQLHDMKMVDDVMKMVELAGGIPIPAGAKVELKPGSLHVMFLELKAPVKEGETIAGTLIFEKAGTIEVEFEVGAPNAGMN
ncbi:copper chaperone PCu(A)C [Aestuariivirga sp.]|uniref:copper chaperone PCu(A)C n=1 Tax=Aestuariivirga sp. TaxID=2650926 RepID=UPI003593CEB7